jgi:hypothetical protein
MGPALFPVVGIAFGKRPDTRFPGFQDIAAGADTLFEFRAFGACRTDGDMVITKISRKSALPPSSVTTTSYFPSALMSTILSRYPLAPDLESSPLWRLMEKITSSAVMVLPLWNSTPLRSLKVHTLASGVESHDSASSGITLKL